MIAKNIPNLKGSWEVKNFAQSARSLCKNLKKDRVHIATGAHGALIVWLDDDSLYRGERQVYGVTEALFEAETQKQLVQWATTQYPLLGKE